MNLCTLEPPSEKYLYCIGFVIFVTIKFLLEDRIDKIFIDSRAKNFELIIIFAIGDLLCGFFVLIMNIKNKSNDILPIKEKKIPSGKIDLAERNALIFNNNRSKLKWVPLKRIIYLSVIDLLSQSCSLIYSFIYKEKELIIPHHNKNILLMVDIISRFILNKMILKAEFYRHYYLSITLMTISFLILSISDIYYMADEDNTKYWIYFLKSFLKIILYSFENIEGKIGLNSEFLNPYNLLFYKGIVQSILLIILSLIFIILKKYYLFIGLFDNKEYRFDFITFLIITFYLLTNIITNICIWKIVDIYSVQHLTIGKGGSYFIFYIIAMIRKDLDYQKGKKIYIFYFTDIFGYILLFIGTLIHNEIIILNFCNLNKYTYIKLKEREEIDLIDRNDTINSCSDNQSQKSGTSQKRKKSSENLDYNNTDNNADSIFEGSIEF
jgi:hypothetical protein